MTATVLIVDDEPANLKLLRVLVEHEGYECLEATGGGQALDILQKRTVDLVLLDMMMPDIDGLAVLKTLRARGVLPMLPVIVLTANHERSLRIEALGLGALEFVCKPFDAFDLRCRMRTLTELGFLREQQAQLAAESAKADLKARIEDAIDALPLLLYQSPSLETFESATWTVGCLEKLTGQAGEVVFADLWTDLVHCEDRPRVSQVYQGILSGEVKDWHLQYRWGVNENWVLHVGKVDFESRVIVGALSDVTETKELESRFLQSQKMEAVGQLSGGLAHDFNNLLCAIIAYTDFARDGGNDESQRQRDLEEVLKAADRAAALTRQLLTFSRRNRCSKEIVDINERLCQLHGLLTRTLGEKIELEPVLSAHPATIEIDPAQFDQLLLNLTQNARDAMPDGGLLRISVESNDGEGPESDRFVRLKVSDTGRGMDRQTRQRIFEPFFTTKSSGSGAGLGLATSFAIVEQARGSIEVESVENQGTTFLVQWPFSRPAALSKPSELPARAFGCGFQVLVVEDEPSLRRVTKRVLEGAGYQVHTASDGEQAKLLIDRVGRDLSAVVTAVVIAKADGLDVVNYLRRTCPETPVVLVAGYMDDKLQDIALENSSLLWKPFQRDELLRVVGEAIGATPSLEQLEVQPESLPEAVPEAAVPPPTSNNGAVGPRGYQARVLLVDDDEVLCQAGIRILEPVGFQVVTRSSFQQARETLASESFDALIVDINLSGGDGLDLLELARGTPAVLMTGSITAETARRAVEQKVQAYLPKPVASEQLCMAVREAVESGRISKLRNKLLASRHGGNEFVGDLRGTEVLFDRALSTIAMHFQPIVRAQDHSIFGYEALLRCGEPQMRNPLKLLAAAEVLGRADDVGRAVRASVAQTLKDHPERTEAIFVNLHPSELQAGYLAKADEPLLEFAPRIILEITERASLRTGPGLSNELKRVRQSGYRVAVDDLGEGYSGLNSLVTLQPHIVKIDMSLVRDIHQAPLKIDIVSALIEMAHRSGILVVGEGVEVVEERDVLVAMGCDLLQGYYLAKPAPPFCSLNSHLETTRS